MPPRITPLRSTPLTTSALLLLLGVAAAGAAARAQGRGFELPPATTTTGVLETATASHDGATERVWLVASAAGTFLVTGVPVDAGKALQKLVGKRVAVEGSLVTELPGDGGARLPVAGKVGSKRYTGNIMVRDAGGVTAQPVTELTGTVAEVEVDAPTPKEPDTTAKVLQLQCGGEPPVVHAIGPQAKKTLQPLLGKTVRVRAFVAGSGEIEAVESASPVEPAK